MPLQIQYSKEIARELGKVAVYFPGDEVKVGDIIRFPFGKKGLFRKTVPWGTFSKVTSLKNLGVPYKESQLSESPDPYRFSTKNAVNITFNGNANADLRNDNLPHGKAALSIKFSSEGAIYFLAVGCDKTGIDDIVALENQIQSKSNLVWDDTFLVTSVTIAKKALIAQSNSKSSELTLGGEVSGLKSNASNINVDAKISITKEKGSSFIKDWSDDVTVFMDVMKLEKEIFSSNKSLDLPSGSIPSEESSERLLLKKVNVEEYLNY
ncbi:MAG: hypothetical protein JXQ93_02320 [Flavobacteriaceae bacterium]